MALQDKLPSPEGRKWYAAKAIEHNWSRNVFVMQIETRWNWARASPLSAARCC